MSTLSENPLRCLRSLSNRLHRPLIQTLTMGCRSNSRSLVNFWLQTKHKLTRVVFARVNAAFLAGIQEDPQRSLSLTMQPFNIGRIKIGPAIQAKKFTTEH